MPLYDLGDLIGKTLIAARDVDIYTNKPVKYGLSPVGKVKYGNPVGVVDSWVTDSDGTILFAFKGSDAATTNTLGMYYVKSGDGAFQVSALKQQGVLTIDEKRIAEEKAKEKAIETLAD